MIERILSRTILSLSKGFPVVALMGPRQTGKTTLAKSLFEHLPYRSMEDVDSRRQAIKDPRGFLQTFPKGAIIDEAQKVPHLFSYLQTLVDENKKLRFVLTGSSHFLLHRKITQSLAGRAAFTTLLPLSMEELKTTKKAPKTAAEAIFKGFYPRLFAPHMTPTEWHRAYVSSYIERDVRDLKNIGDLRMFEMFLHLCAGRTGQILNLSSMAQDLGVTHNTVRSWLSILEASFVVFLMSTHSEKFSKRVLKQPKLYFYDVGLVTFLLGIRDKKEVPTHWAYGHLFENYAIVEAMKSYTNRGEKPPFFYWRDNAGHEVDLIIQEGMKKTIVEIKGGKTINNDYFKGLNYYAKLSKGKERKVLLSCAEFNETRSGVDLVSWENAARVAR